MPERLTHRRILIMSLLAFFTILLGMIALVLSMVLTFEASARRYVFYGSFLMIPLSILLFYLIHRTRKKYYLTRELNPSKDVYFIDGTAYLLSVNEELKKRAYREEKMVFPNGELDIEMTIYYKKRWGKTYFVCLVKGTVDLSIQPKINRYIKQFAFSEKRITKYPVFSIGICCYEFVHSLMDEYVEPKNYRFVRRTHILNVLVNPVQNRVYFRDDPYDIIYPMEKYRRFMRDILPINFGKDVTLDDEIIHSSRGEN